MTNEGKAQKLLDEITKEPKNSKKFSWKKITMIVSVLFVVSLAMNIFGAGSITGFTASNNDIISEVETFLADNYDVQAKVTDIETESGLFKLELEITSPQGTQTMTSYATKDGSLLFPSAIEMVAQEEGVEAPVAQQQPTQDITKSDKPKVELFVMSHCPFGTQAEKGMLPVAELLGDKIDFEIKFVNYAMHGEKEVNEQLRQVCIQEEQPDKYFTYLWSFLDSDDYEQALKDADIDTAKLDKCVAKLDKEYKATELLEDKDSWVSGRFPQFNVHEDENIKYGVKGSPTLVINGQQVSSSRDSASYLANVCAAFNNAPEECNEQLSSAQPSTGFGLSGTGAASAATCG
jgi:glutaredoxin